MALYKLVFNFNLCVNIDKNIVWLPKCRRGRNRCLLCSKVNGWLC